VVAVLVMWVVGVTSVSAAVVAGPKVSGFSPASGVRGTPVVITGTGFLGATSVRFGGREAGFSVDSPTHITATLPASALTGKVRVATPAGAAQAASLFTVAKAVRPAKTAVSSLSPASGDWGTSVVIHGGGFTGATGVEFGRVSAEFTVDSDSQITATVPAHSSTGHVRVESPTGAAQSTLFISTHVLLNVASFSPTSGIAGVKVVILGTAFRGINLVSIGGVDVDQFTIDSSTQITATVPDGVVWGPIEVASNIVGVTFSTQLFRVPPAVVVSSLAPASLAPGGRVVITGAGFTGAAGVTFGGVAATTFTVDSDSQVSAIVPDGAVTGAIRITAPGGSGDSSTFTVLPVPSWFRGISATSGAVGGRVVVTVDPSVVDSSTGEAWMLLGPHFNGVEASSWVRNDPPEATDANVILGIPRGATSGYITFTFGGVIYTVPTWFTITS
jgi:hypothetical protein